MATNIGALPQRLREDPEIAHRPDTAILLTEEEVALILSVPPATMRTWRARKKYDIRAKRLGSRVRYTWAETLRLLSEGVK